VLPLLESVAPDVILMDVDMPGCGGVAAASCIRASYPSCRILFLTGYQRYATVGLQAGAHGYVLKQAGEDTIAEAIRTVDQGGVYLQPEIQAVVVDGLQHGTAAQLSEPQIAIMRMLADGSATRDIGEALGLSEHRVKQQIRAILDQLGAHDRAHAVAIALRTGLI
jgi:DNA-binding NarL/FixJ family response regulator